MRCHPNDERHIPRPAQPALHDLVINVVITSQRSPPEKMIKLHKAAVCLVDYTRQFWYFAHTNNKENEIFIIFILLCVCCCCVCVFRSAERKLAAEAEVITTQKCLILTISCHLNLQFCIFGDWIKTRFIANLTNKMQLNAEL